LCLDYRRLIFSCQPKNKFKDLNISKTFKGKTCDPDKISCMLICCYLIELCVTFYDKYDTNDGKENRPYEQSGNG
jgi:hypothetical protein